MMGNPPTISYHTVVSRLQCLDLFRSSPSPLCPSVSFPAPQQANHSSEEAFGRSEEESALSAAERERSSAEAAVDGGAPSPVEPPPSPPRAKDTNQEPPPSAPRAKDTNQTAKLFTPSKLNFSVRTFHSSWASFKMFCQNLPILIT